MNVVGDGLRVAPRGVHVEEFAPQGEATRSWQDIVTNLAGASGVPVGGSLKGEPLTQLTGLLKTQLEVCRYQLKVEMVSKIAESAVASIRKLQQPQ